MPTFYEKLVVPATQAVAIDPSGGDVTLAPALRAIYVGTGGDLKVDLANADAVVFANVPDGTVLPLAVEKVYQTGTDASDIVGLR